MMYVWWFGSRSAGCVRPRASVARASSVAGPAVGRRVPVEPPEPPGVPDRLAEQRGVGERPPAVGADLDADHVRVARPGGPGHGVRAVRGHHLLLGRAGDLGLAAHLLDRHVDRVPGQLGPVGVVDGPVVAGELPVQHHDPVAPLDRRHAVPPADHQPDREPVRQRQRAAVHADRQQGVVHLPHGDAVGVVDLARRGRLLLGTALVGPLEHDLDGPRLHAGPGQHVGQRDAGPLGVADRPQLPLRPVDLRDQEHAAVAGALQRGRAGLLGHAGQLVHGQLERPLDVPLDPHRNVARSTCGSGLWLRT